MHTVARETGREQVSSREMKMRDRKLRSVKCFVKLILIWGTALGYLTSSLGAEIILAGSAGGVRYTHIPA